MKRRHLCYSLLKTLEGHCMHSCALLSIGPNICSSFHQSPYVTPLAPIRALIGSAISHRKPRWPIGVEEDATFPVDQSLAPTVVESNVPERRLRSSLWKEDNGFFFRPLSARNNKNKPNLNFKGGFTEYSHLKEEGSEGLEPRVFVILFRFFSSPFPKRGFCVSRRFVLRSRRKDDGRRGRSEGATEAESRLFDAIVKREEANDQFAKSLRHLHTPGEASRRR